MRLIHITDPHLTSLAAWSLKSLRGKRWQGYLSWQRNRQRQHRAEMLAHLLSAVRAENAAHWLLTGDLAQIGLPAEIAAAGDWLRAVASPDQLFLIPGNHDVYAADSWPAICAQWADYLPIDAGSDPADPAAAYPLLRECGGVALIGLNSAVPTAPFLARGALGSAQRERLAALLADVHGRGLFSCVLIHHPPLPRLTHWRKALADVRALQTLISELQPGIVLHGHEHRNFDSRCGATRVFATASASSVRLQHFASYRVLDLHHDANGWKVSMTLKQFQPGSPGTFSVREQQVWQRRWPAVNAPDAARAAPAPAATTRAPSPLQTD
ncbi:MAG: metallophosphoesterase [Lysobacterales bacterium CG_4_10_14_3_um_filter_64_11]|nr:MAG: metallophosphoesterase [Xanthomonadales bacterium CG_4_10_14_3_um_filter_64_11]